MEARGYGSGLSGSGEDGPVHCLVRKPEPGAIEPPNGCWTALTFSAGCGCDSISVYITRC
jgi:hypothetical protein